MAGRHGRTLCALRAEVQQAARYMSILLSTSTVCSLADMACGHAVPLMPSAHHVRPW